MFLFDKTRHGRQRYASGNLVTGVRWKTFLNTHPAYGAESTAAFDRVGNLYFGSHSGNFYSLSPDGRIRWAFSTKKKIYGSPIVGDDAIFFAGGDGYFYSLSLEGHVRWIYDLCPGYRGRRGRALRSWITHLPFTFNPALRQVILINSWSSPNQIKCGFLITGYGKGLHCVDKEGRLLWDFDLGFPRNQLSGVAVDHNDRIYCAARSGTAYALSPDGRMLWKRLCLRFGEPWGNPVVAPEADRVLFFYSRVESKGAIFAYDLGGELKWSFSCSTIRGSAAISADGQSAYFCDFRGYLYCLSLENGREIEKVRIGRPRVARSLWITPSLDNRGNILLSTKDGPHQGRIIKLNKGLDEIWTWTTDKVLSVPVVGPGGEIYFGAWDGYYYCLETT